MAKDEQALVVEIEAPQAVVEEFRVGFQAQMAMAKIRQEKINAETRRIRHKLVEGLGQHVASIDADVYFAMRARFGRDCWRNKAFLEDCIRKGMVEKPKMERKCVILRP